MGREAECVCQWGEITVQVRALLESGELILRGDLRRRVPFAGMQGVRVEGDRLCFRFKAETVSLALGGATAERWVKIISSPPVSLAKKLGITPELSVWVLGEIDDEALREALAESKAVTGKGSDLIVARVETPGDVAGVLRKSASAVDNGAALWMVYPKGKGHALSETDVRDAAREIGLIDTKVASVSPRLTALRFVKRKSV